MPLGIRQILESHIPVFKLGGHRPLCVHENRTASGAILRAFEGDDHALPVGHVIEIQERCNPGLDRLGHGNGIHGSVPEVEQTITRLHTPVRAERLEQNQLILREFQIRAQLLVKSIQRGFATHFIDPVEAFDSGKGYSVLVYHKSIKLSMTDSPFYVQNYKISRFVAK